MLRHRLREVKNAADVPSLTNSLNLQMDSLALPAATDDGGQVRTRWISLWAKHANLAFGWFVGQHMQILEANGCIDVTTWNRLARLRATGESDPSLLREENRKNSGWRPILVRIVS